MKQIKINNKVYTYEDNLTLEDISKSFTGEFYVARVNGRLRELVYSPKDGDIVEFLDITRNDSQKVYQASLRYLICMALHNVYPKEKIRFSPSISMAFYAKIYDTIVEEGFLDKLRSEIDRLISLDLPIVRKKYSIDEMNKYYKKCGYIDKIENLKYRDKDTANCYECNGYRNYMYSYMVPRTSYLSKYNLVLYYPGFMVQFPRSETKGEIPEFSDEPKFLKCLSEANHWSNITNTNNIYEINKIAEDRESLIKYINLCEARHNQYLYEIGSAILKDKDRIKLVMIAGPSSSGKTTFSKRLEIELLSRGFETLRISIDNYYLRNEDVPRNADGTPDFEDINALDIKLFNDNMLSLIKGEPTKLPIFDFKTKKRHFTDSIILSQNQIIIIEGIHALNETLSKLIPKYNKYKIYIAPLAQRNIDDHSPISLTDLRLVRRIVRDKQFRNTPPQETLSMWKTVRQGEHKWIYPFMEEADYIFNSELGYEMLALKRFGVESLKKISDTDPNYIRANALLKFLKIYKDINLDLIPNNSLVREFIGGGVFED